MKPINLRRAKEVELGVASQWSLLILELGSGTKVI